jgi:phage gpG-like protein
LIRFETKDDFSKVLRHKIKRLSGREMYTALGEEAVAIVRDNIDKGQGVKTFKKSIRVRLQGGTTLKHTGRLYNSLRAAITTQPTRSNDGAVTVGSSLIYSRILNFGGTITAKGDYLTFQIVPGVWVKKKSVTIPKREYLVIPKNKRARLVKVLKQYVEE